MIFHEKESYKELFSISPVFLPLRQGVEAEWGEGGMNRLNFTVGAYPPPPKKTLLVSIMFCIYSQPLSDIFPASDSENGEVSYTHKMLKKKVK